MTEDFRAVRGDCLDVLRGLPDSSIDAVVTDPPYALSFMGRDWDRVLPGVEYWREMLRVAKPGAMLLAFGGTRTFHRLFCLVEDAGWEMRDCIGWVYGSGFPKSQNISKQLEKRGWAGDGAAASATEAAKRWDGWGTNLKPAWEPVCLAMKPLDGTFAQNALKWKVAGLWIDGCRVPSSGGRARENEPSQERRYADRGGTNFAMKPGPRGGDPSGRWPSNLILDEDAAALIDEQSGERKAGGSVKGDEPSARTKNAYGEHVRTPFRGHGDTGGASRFFYVAKASRKERTLDGRIENAHPTVKPLTLMRYLCRLVRMPERGVILDPFMGSGTTGEAALREGFRFVGIEKDSESFETALSRLRCVREDLMAEGNVSNSA